MGRRDTNSSTGRHDVRAGRSRTGGLRRRWLPRLARVSAGLALMVFIGWLAGKILGDARHATQYLAWIPTSPVLVVVVVLWVVSAIAGGLALRPGGVMLRPIVVFAGVFLLGWFLWVDLRVGNLPKTLASPDGEPVLIRYWNLAVAPGLEGAGEAVTAGLADGLTDQVPGIVIVANPRADRQREALFKALMGVTPSADERVEGGVYFARTRELAVASAVPIVRWGRAALPELRRASSVKNRGGGPGSVTFMVFDDPQLGGGSGGGLGDGDGLVVWIVDLPSDPWISRERVMTEARRAAEAWSGEPMVPSAIGGWTTGKAMTGFPRPDVILGDFNTPVGGDAVEILTGDLVEAHRAHGFGPSGTWPLGGPIGMVLWAIDGAYVREDLPASAYRVIDPGTLGSGTARHKIIELELRRPVAEVVRPTSPETQPPKPSDEPS